MIILSACKYTYVYDILLQRYSCMHVIEQYTVYLWGTLVLYSSFISSYSPHTWTAYLNTESKIAKYTVLRRSVLTYLNLASKPKLLLSLVFIWICWKFQVRCSSRYIPKYLALFTGFIFLPLSWSLVALWYFYF